MRYVNWTGKDEAWVLLAGAPDGGAPADPTFGRVLRFVTQDPRANGMAARALSEAMMDVEEAFCFSMADAMARADGSDFVALPFRLASRMAAAETALFDLRTEHVNLIATVQAGALPVESAGMQGERDEVAPIRLTSETAEAHEGGGSCAYFEFTEPDRWVVVDKRQWDDLQYPNG